MIQKTKIRLMRYIYYGRERLYPKDEITRAICHFLKRRTLSRKQVEYLEKKANCSAEILEPPPLEVYQEEGGKI